MDGECVFCRAFGSSNDQETVTLWRSQYSFALLNLYPYTSGHCMVAPIKHCAEFTDLDDETLAEIMVGARELVAIIKEQYSPHGFNIGFNVGEAGGAGIREHLHLHVVPRWKSDTNFIDVLGKTRVLPETIDQTFERLRAAVERRRR